jgi:lactoylglutathione lyase
VTDNYDAAYALHKEMGCICYENTAMGLYFIEDPDGYWLEIVSAKR